MDIKFLQQTICKNCLRCHQNYTIFFLSEPFYRNIKAWYFPKIKNIVVISFLAKKNDVLVETKKKKKSIGFYFYPCLFQILQTLRFIFSRNTIESDLISSSSIPDSGGAAKPKPAKFLSSVLSRRFLDIPAPTAIGWSTPAGNPPECETSHLGRREHHETNNEITKTRRQSVCVDAYEFQWFVFI